MTAIWECTHYQSSACWRSGRMRTDWNIHCARGAITCGSKCFVKFRTANLFIHVRKSFALFSFPDIFLPISTTPISPGALLFLLFHRMPNNFVEKFTGIALAQWCIVETYISEDRRQASCRRLTDSTRLTLSGAGDPRARPT